MTFEIYGDIVASDAERSGPADVTCFEFAARTRALAPGEDVELHVNSCGGDVFGGMGIVAAINTLRVDGHKTRAVVDGLAASMASVIACACDELSMHDGAMLMVHNPWTLVQGDAPELRKQAYIMDKMTASMIAVYQRHFDLSTDEIARLMDDETWISTDDLGKYRLRAEVIEGAARIAASISKSKFYAHVKEKLMIDENEDETKKTDGETEDTPVVEQAPDIPVEEEQTDKPTEETVEELRERIAELERENDELRKQLDAPVEDRVRGMQSKMQARLNAATTDFNNQLQARVAELTAARAEVTSLRADLEKAKGELSATTSALTEKTHALAQLNAGVLTPHAAEPTPRTRDEARRALAKLPMGKRADYYRKHRALIDG